MLWAPSRPHTPRTRVLAPRAASHSPAALTADGAPRSSSASPLLSRSGPLGRQGSVCGAGGLGNAGQHQDEPALPPPGGRSARARRRLTAALAPHADGAAGVDGQEPPLGARCACHAGPGDQGTRAGPRDQGQLGGRAGRPPEVTAEDCGALRGGGGEH